MRCVASITAEAVRKDWRLDPQRIVSVEHVPGAIGIAGHLRGRQRKPDHTSTVGAQARLVHVAAIAANTDLGDEAGDEVGDVHAALFGAHIELVGRGERQVASAVIEIRLVIEAVTRQVAVGDAQCDRLVGARDAQIQRAFSERRPVR